jgi:flagellar L-ring protein precursor FlgH
VPDNGWSLTSDVRLPPGDVLTVMLRRPPRPARRPTPASARTASLGVARGDRRQVAQDRHRPEQQTDFTGTAASTQQNTLQGAITVVVQEVLPNGLLRVQGEKSLYLNQGEEMIRLAGYVRAADVDADNRVSSQRIANARIAYAGSGALADANNAGWLTRFFASPWMPF